MTLLCTHTLSCHTDTYLLFLLDLLTGVMLTLDPWVDNKSFLLVQLQKVDHDANGQAHQTHLVTMVQRLDVELEISSETSDMTNLRPQIIFAKISKVVHYQLIDTKASKVGKSYTKMLGVLKLRYQKERPTDHPTNCYVPLSTLPFWTNKMMP